MRISSVRSTYCFVATGDRLAQVIRVVVADATPTALAEVSLVGEGLQWAEPWRGCLDPTWTGRADGPAWVPSADAGLGTPARFTSAPNLPDGVVGGPGPVRPGVALGQRRGHPSRRAVR